jgi:hypothetical protein
MCSPQKGTTNLQPDGNLDGLRLDLDLWLSIRSACHKINGFWDAVILGLRNGTLPQNVAAIGRHDGCVSKTRKNIPKSCEEILKVGDDIICLKGRWAHRARNCSDLVEPLEEANFLYIGGRGEYNPPSRFRILNAAYKRYEDQQEKDARYRKQPTLFNRFLSQVRRTGPISKSEAYPAKGNKSDSP